MCHGGGGGGPPTSIEAPHTRPTPSSGSSLPARSALSRSCVVVRKNKMTATRGLVFCCCCCCYFLFVGTIDFARYTRDIAWAVCGRTRSSHNIQIGPTRWGRVRRRAFVLLSEVPPSRTRRGGGWDYGSRDAPRGSSHVGLRGELGQQWAGTCLQWGGWAKKKEAWSFSLFLFSLSGSRFEKQGRNHC